MPMKFAMPAKTKKDTNKYLSVIPYKSESQKSPPVNAVIKNTMLNPKHPSAAPLIIGKYIMLV